MKEPHLNAGAASVHVLMDLALDLGYGRQIAQGIRRFRSKRPDWIFHNRNLLRMASMQNLLYHGAIGHFPDPAHRTALASLGIPYFVNVSNRSGDRWSACVISDDFAVGRMAAEYFLARGHRNFGYLREPWSHFALEREEGFLKRLRKAGVPKPQTWILHEFDPAAIDADLLPMALFAMSDDSAVRAIGKLQSAGYRVPEDVAVLGVDDDDLADVVSPVGLSSIRLAAGRIGFAACELLEQMINRGERDTGVYRFAPVEVIERRSTGGHPVAEPRLRRAHAFIEDNLTHLKRVEEVAAGVGLSRRSLDRLFIEHVEVSPADWIAQRRTERAETLLRETDYTVEHVAELVGFEDRRRLYRAFKKLNRPLPKEIRGRK